MTKHDGEGTRLDVLIERYTQKRVFHLSSKNPSLYYRLCTDSDVLPILVCKRHHELFIKTLFYVRHVV